MRMFISLAKKKFSTLTTSYNVIEPSAMNYLQTNYDYVVW